MPPDHFCVIDLETTGLNPRYDSILEMSAIKYYDNKVVDKFDNFVDVDDSIPEFVQNLTGITNNDSHHGLPLDVLLDKYLAFIGANVVVGHNINFDLNFIYDCDFKILN